MDPRAEVESSPSRCGVGKLGTPWARMQFANLSAADPAAEPVPLLAWMRRRRRQARRRK